MPWVDDTKRGRMLSRVGAAEAALYRDETPSGDQRGPLERIRDFIQQAIPKGAFVLGALFVINAGSGFLARKVIGHVFGAGAETDALTAATQLVGFPVAVLVLGGVVGPFLPIFVGLKGEAKETADEFTHTILTAALVAVGVALGFIVVLAPQLSGMLVPGYSETQRDLYINLVRVLCAGQLAMAASLVLGEILVAERRWWTYGLAEFASWGGIAVGSLVLGGVLGIYGAAIGWLLGGLGHLGVRLVGIYRTSFRPRLSLAFGTKGVGEFGLLILPRMVSSVFVAVLGLYSSNIASSLAPGSTTSVAYALDFQSTAENVVGVAFALAAFSALSAAAAAGDKRAFKKIFTTNALRIGLFSILAAVTLAVMAPFIAGLFKGGAFDDTDASRMTLVMVILAISIPFESLVELVARAIMATHNTLEPMLATAAGFTVAVIVTTTLSGPLGLAALPLGYAVFRATQLAVLAAFLRPRMARIGGASRWSRAIVRDRWGDVQDNRQPLPLGQLALMALLLVALTGGTAFAATQALSHTSLAADPIVTPWARVGGTRPPAISPDPSSSGSVASARPSGSAASPSLLPSATSGTFAMDLYQDGDFVSEAKDTWCVPAAMQTSMNIMSATPDTTRDTQARLFDLAVSIAGSSAGGADPDGWAEALSVLGYGHFQVSSRATLVEAIHVMARQIRITQRPGGLLVWRGWHSWVMSGFTATADPATTEDFTVLTVRIEDVWYPRVSTIWPKSRPPDAEVPVNGLPPDYVKWNQGSSHPDREGLYVFVEPTL